MIVHTDVPQGSKLPPSLLSFSFADMPRSKEPVKRLCYADDNRVGIRSYVSGTRAQIQHLHNGDVPFLTGQLAIDVSTKVISNLIHFRPGASQ